MKKLFLFGMSIAFAAIVSLNATASENPKDVIGEWKYEVATAPDGYNKGVIAISEKEGQLTGEVKLADGSTIELKNVSYAEQVLKFGLYLDYEYIEIKARIEGNTMIGTVNSPEGPIELKAERTK
jgi:hypothetical protein